MIQLEMILVMSLYETLHKDMGLNLEKEDGFESFGIRARKVEFVLPPSFVDFWTYLIILMRSFLIVCQHFL